MDSKTAAPREAHAILGTDDATKTLFAPATPTKTAHDSMPRLRASCLLRRGLTPVIQCPTLRVNRWMTTKTTTARPASATKVPLHGPSAATATARATPNATLSLTHILHAVTIPIRMEQVTRLNEAPNRGRARVRVGSQTRCALLRATSARTACNASVQRPLAGVAAEALVAGVAGEVEADRAVADCERMFGTRMQHVQFVAV